MPTPTTDADLRYVYFIEAVGLNRVKIGIAKDPRRRLGDLQVGSPVILRLMSVFLVDEPAEWERGFHRRYADHHVTGEWYNMSKDLRAIAESGFQPGDQIRFVSSRYKPTQKPLLHLRKRPYETVDKFLGRLQKLCEAKGCDVIDWAA